MKKRMKKRTIALIVLGCILGAILIAVSVCAIIANSRNDRSKPIETLSSWQDMIADDALLKNVVIAGAHDAGTKGLPYFAATQDRSVLDLILCGTRYFDLRVSYSGNRLRIYHGPSKGVALDGILDDVKDFLEEHTSETLILDFQHFDNGDLAQPATIAMLEDKLAGLMVVNDTDESDVEFIDALTLGQVRGKALVVWGVDNNEILSKDFVFKRNNDSGTRQNSVLHSYYQTALNTKSSASYIAQAIPQYIASYKSVNSGLFVLQCQLTDGLYVFGPRFREATHTDRMNNYIQNLKTSDDLHLINVIMRDFVSPKKNCLALQLNVEKGLVKSERITDFNDMLNAHL